MDLDPFRVWVSALITSEAPIRLSECKVEEGGGEAKQLCKKVHPLNRRLKKTMLSGTGRFDLRGCVVASDRSGQDTNLPQERIEIPSAP
jgi:hypothetical protein